MGCPTVLIGGQPAARISDMHVCPMQTPGVPPIPHVGGPIMPPELRNILLIPVAAHLSMNRAIILSEGAEVEMTAYTDHEAVMSVDGRPALQVLDGDCVAVRASEHTVRFIRFQDPGYFYRNITAYMEQNPAARVTP